MSGTPGLRRGVQVGIAAALGLAWPAMAELIRPAELPPAGYAGQQYVDSRGCLFMRAGTPGNVLWLPRVTRDGVPLCGNPPSGRRVPVMEEGASTDLPAADPAPEAAAAPTEAPVRAPTGMIATGGYFVAVGSFGVAENVDKAVAKLGALGYLAVEGRLQGGSAGLVTVFAGPFDTADAAAWVQQDLRNAGFPDAVVIAP
jgi:hypothetical protein